MRFAFASGVCARAISGVFSVVSHSVLQYLPDVVTHEQTGCAHFSAFSAAIALLPTSDLARTIQVLMLVTRGKYFCTERNTLRYWLGTLSPRWQSVGFLTSAAANLANGCDRLPGSAGRGEVRVTRLQSEQL